MERYWESTRGLHRTPSCSFLVYMNAFELTRQLIDIESITENEYQAGIYLHDHLSKLAEQFGGTAEQMPVAPKRFNVFAQWGTPVVTLSTHFDTVPPFFPSREDDTRIWGRGSCDTKGIIAVDDLRGSRTARSGRTRFRPALCRRRGAQQRRGLRGCQTEPRIALS